MIEKIKAAFLVKKYIEGKIDIKQCLELKDNKLTVLGQDAFILYTKHWGRLMNELLKLHGPAIVTTLKESHKITGVKDIEAIKKIVPISKISKIFDIWFKLGYAEKIIEIITIVKGKEFKYSAPDEFFEEYSKTKILPEKTIIRVKGTLSSRALKAIKVKTKYPACVFEPSYILGALETIFGTKFNLEETKCEAMGHKYCEWVITMAE